LRPLCRFAQQAEQVETSNLSEIRLDEETLPELRSLTHALNEMLERLSRGFDAQRQFVGNAAHELRTPLTLLQTQLELFPDEHPDIPPESAAFLAALQDEVQRLNRLTHALLDMSDLQSVPRNDVILLSPMIDEVFADLAPLAERNGISLSREGENITVVGSDMLLCRMFSNLVENAVKYNHPGGMVKVDVQQRDRQAVIHVADTGRGIPQEFWQSIFQPFFRVDKSLSHELGGAGLGLPLVWEIARLHGGRVWVEESNDNGSALAVTLLLSASITDTVRR
jgi:signal transduction histidine kinase